MSALAGCCGPTSGGRLALLGRAKLRAEMSAPGTPHPLGSCPCGSCGAPEFTTAEAETAARHLSNRDAVAYVLERVTVSSFADCPHCGAWVPILVRVEATSDVVVPLPLGGAGWA